MKPILFNSEMVRAILDGRKTCTRRVIKAPGLYADPNDPPTHIREWEGGAFSFQWNNRGNNSGHIVLHPPYKKGDILYVRETWAPIFSAGEWEDTVEYAFKANPSNDGVSIRWHPSIHMPREAARIFLRVTDVRVERLQNMSEDDACKEGYAGCQNEHVVCFPEGGMEHCVNVPGECPFNYWYCDHSLPEGFGRDIWDSTIKPADLPLYGWEANPWVWAIEFKRCKKPEEKP